MKIGYFTFTKQGLELVSELNRQIPGEIFPMTGIKENMERTWQELDIFVCVMASGIVVRYIAPLLRGKDRDPAVIVIDSSGRYVISLLSGHLGGGNAFAKKLADVCGGEAVITTATDREGVPAFDEVAKKNHLIIQNLNNIKIISRTLLNHDDVNVVIDPIYSVKNARNTLYLRPQTLVVGVGCKRGMNPEQMISAYEHFEQSHELNRKTIRALATVDLKAGEPAMTALADYLEVPLMIISRKMIQKLNFEKVQGGPIECSEFVEKTIGVGSVAEAASYLAACSVYSGHNPTGRSEDTLEHVRLKLKKEKENGITFAVSEIGQTIEL